MGGEKEYKIQPNYIQSTDKLPTTEELNQRTEYRKHRPIFCFKHLADKDGDFGIKKIGQIADFRTLLSKFKMYSELTWGQIEQCSNYHAGEIQWRSMKKNQFPENCIDFPPYKFGTSDSFRVFGYHNQGIFFIVWLDPNHKMINMS